MKESVDDEKVAMTEPNFGMDAQEDEQPKSKKIGLIVRMVGGEKKTFIGTGATKKAAKNDAAKMALKYLVSNN